MNQPVTYDPKNETLCRFPDHWEERPPQEQRVYTLLDSLGISYTHLDHEAADTMEQCLAIEQRLEVRICKNLLLCNAQKTLFFLLMMSGEKKFRTAVFSKKMGCARLSFADAAHMKELLDLTPGSVSVLGLMNDTQKQVRLVMDEDVLKDEFIGCHPCKNTSTLKIRKEDLLTKLLPAMGHGYETVALE